MKISDPDLLRQQCLINGVWTDADSRAFAEVLNPATAAVMGSIPLCGRAETSRAVLGAEDAFRMWRNTTAKARCEILRRLATLMLQHKDDLALIMTTEQGKPLAEAGAAIVYAASFIEWFAEEARRQCGDTIPAPQNDRRLVVLKEPVGVCAAITP